MKYQNQFSEDYKKIKHDADEGDICEYTNSFFEEFPNNDIINECDDFLYGSLRKGISMLKASTVEQLREVKREYDVMEEKRNKENITINLTLFGTDDYYKNKDDYNEEYEQYSPMKLFNTKKMKQLQILIKYMLLSVYRNLLNSLQDSIFDGFDNQKQLFLILGIIYLSICFLLYVFFWRTYVNSLSKIIYKTKNMLSIIPKEVLASLNSIHKLLKLNTSSTLPPKPVVKNVPSPIPIPITINK